MSRADRRRQRKEDERTVARGLDVVNRSGAEVVALMRVLHERVREAQGAGSVRPLMAFLQANMDQAALRVASVPVACGRGCAHCCSCIVSVMAPEAIHVAAALGARRDEAEAKLQAALARNEQAAPCPLLEGGLCSVYRDRPLTCRTAASLDAQACRRSYVEGGGDGVPFPGVYGRMRLGYSLALAGALRQAGLNHQPGELKSALVRVMASAESEARWLSGADIFAGLPRGNAGDPFQLQENRALYDAAFG